MKALLTEILGTYADCRTLELFGGLELTEAVVGLNQTLAAIYIVSCIDYNLPSYKAEKVTIILGDDLEISVSISKNEIKDYAAIVVGTNSIYLKRGPEVGLDEAELVDLINHVWLSLLRTNNDNETR